MTTEERLAKVERELGRAKLRSRWLLAALGLGLGALALVWASAASVPSADAQGAVGAGPKIIRANAFILEDENGKVRGGLVVTKDGLGLNLVDENGKPLVELGVGPDGPRLALDNENGKGRAALTVGKDGPRLDLGDVAGKVRARLVVGADGPGLDLHDENGKTRATLVLLKAGPGLALFDAAGEVRTVLNVGADGPRLVLFDDKGKVHTRLSTDKKGPALEGNAPLGDRPPGPGLDTEGYVFTELATVRISPRFELDQGLAMGQWSYKAYRVLDKSTGQVSQALQLQVELQPGGVSLPPLFVEAHARTSGNRLVGSGTLFAKRVGIMEKLPYEGILFVDSFGEVDVITIKRGL